MLRKRKRKNPKYSRTVPLTAEGTLQYIFKNYNLRILEDINLQKILKNTLNINFINSGSQADVFRIQFDKKFIIENEKNKTMLYSDKDYALKLTYVGWECIRKTQILSKHKLIPKVYFITNDFIIMDYIKGILLADFFKLSIESSIIENVQKQHMNLIKNLSKFYHISEIDIPSENFIVDMNFIVHFIDPCN